MTRTYNTVSVARNRDQDWIALSVGAKAVYDILTTQPDIEACGTLPLTLRRWSNSLNDDDRPRLSEWLNELIQARFVVVDKDSEELLVRTFVKWDHGYKNAKRRLAIIASAQAAHSRKVREALRIELSKLGIRDVPDPDPTRMAAASDPDPTGIDGPSMGHPSGIDGPSMGDQSGIDPPRVVVTEVSTHHNPLTTIQNPGREPGASAPEPPHPHCTKHPNGTDDPCAPCGRARKTRDEWDAAAPLRARARAAALAAERAACPTCDPDGWRLDPDGLPTAARCTHQPELASATG